MRDEPAIALVELVNENSLLEFWVRGLLNGGTPSRGRGHWYAIPATYMAQLDRLWNPWLRKTLRRPRDLAAAWEGDLREYEDPAHGSVRRLARRVRRGLGAALSRPRLTFTPTSSATISWR